MDLIRNILSHFQKNKASKKPITINGVTFQQINNNLQQNNDSAETNNKQYIDIEVSPPKKPKKDVNEFKNNDIPENSNISDAKVSFDDEQKTVSVNNKPIFTVIDLTDSLEVQNALEVGETTETSNISEASVSFDADSVIDNDGIKIIDPTDNVNSHNASEICKIGESDKISKVSDKQIANSVNNENIKFKNDPSIFKDIIPSDGKETEVPLNRNTDKAINIDKLGNSINNTLQNSQNIHKIGETTENGNISEDKRESDHKQTRITINDNDNLKTIDDTDNLNCNKLHNSKNKPILVTNYLTENNELALINDNTEVTTTDCIREFENILANVENNLNLDPEINVDDVDDLINDLRFDSDNEFKIFDTESQIPIHIISKNLEKHTSSDVDFSYDITVESVDPVKPIEFPVETNNITKEKDTKIKITANIGNTIVTAITNNTNIDLNNIMNTAKDSKIKTKANDSNTKQDVKINTNNGNTDGNTATDETKYCDTISISSDDITNTEEPIYISDSSDPDCGYHSSDFEFITEDEAKREGFIINNTVNLANKEFKAKHDSRLPNIKKITSNGKNVQAQPLRTLKMPTNGKNAKARTRPLKRYSNNITFQPGSSQCLRPALSVQRPICSSNPVQMPLNIQAGPSNLVQMPSNIQARPSSPVQLPFNIQARPSNPVQLPFKIQAGTSHSVQIPSNIQAVPNNPVQMSLNIQARPSNSIQGPLNIQTRPFNPVQMPLNIQAGPSNPVQMPSNIKPGPSNPVQLPFNIQARPNNSAQMPSNIQVGPSNPVQMPLNIQAESSNPVQMPSNIQPGPSNPVQMPSNILAGPRNSVHLTSNTQARTSNPAQMPTNIQARTSNPAQMPTNIQAGPSNPAHNPSNVQPLPNYEMYRNKYKKPFKYDTGYKNNHNEPEGAGYIDLFRGFHAGVYPMYTRENKSLNPHYSNANRIWYQGIGFDMHMMRRNSSDKEADEFIDEAYETVRKIKSEYPVENRKKRRFREK